MTPQHTTASVSSDQLLDALASYNHISSNINRLGDSGAASMQEILFHIVKSAVKVVSGSSAVIYTYDHRQNTFTPSSRLSAGELMDLTVEDVPRPGGMGALAIQRQSKVLSYEEPHIDIHPAKRKAGALAVACFPLIVAEKILGALYLYLHEERPFDALELLLLENFVNQAAMTIYQAGLVDNIQRDLTRKEEEIKRLHRAGLLISSRPRLEETMEAILQMALEVTSAQYGCFRLLDESGKNLVVAAIAGDTRPMTDALPIDGSSVMAWVAQHRQSLCIPDVNVAPWAEIYYPLDEALEIRSELAVPLISASGRLEGVLNLESPTANTFSEQDSHLLQAMATQAVIAIQEVLLLDALQEISELLLTESCNNVLERLSTLACELLNAAASAVWILEGEDLVLQAASAGHVHGKRIPLHESLVGKAVLQLQPIISDNVQTDPSFNLPELARAQDWNRALVVPLVSKASPSSDPVGAFSVYSIRPAPGRFTESDWDKKVLTILAHYAALAVQNAARQEAMRYVQDQHTLAETFAAMGDVAANLLHQMNNKIGTIPVRIQGIQDKSQAVLAQDSYLSANLAEIKKSARQAMGIVRENLSLLRPIHPIPVSIKNSILEALQDSDLPDSINIEMTGLENLPAVMAGQQSLRMVFINLLENARRAMQDQGTIQISGVVKEHRVEVSLRDTGPGIPPELHDSIFEFNFSGDENGHAGKLGFGLWWVKTLVVRLGGSVSVRSDGKSGTTFLIKLPWTEEESNRE